MQNNKVALYVEAYESGSHDLKSLNKWLKEDGLRLVAKNGKIIKVVAL